MDKMKTVTRTEMVQTVTFTFHEDEIHKVFKQCELLGLKVDANQKK